MIGLKIKKFEEKYKILVIIAILSALCFLEYYFLFILKISTIFTHLFYIPTILACLWWKNRGLIVPIFLTGLLIFFSFCIGLNIIIDNLIQGIIIIFTGYFVGFLSKQTSKAEQKLRESEEKYRNILESIKEVYYEVDTRGNFTFLTEKFIELVGYPKKELLGFNYSKIVSKEDVERVYTILDNMYRKDIQEILFEYTLVKKDGTKRSFENSAYLKYDSEGNKIGFYGLARDITERKNIEQKLMESEQKFRHLFENSPLSIALMDTQGKFLDCNPSAENLFGYKRDEVIGKHFTNIGKFPLNSYSKVMKNFKTIIKGNSPKPLEIPLSKKDGSLIFVMLYSSIAQISGKTLFYFIIQDISAIKETQRKIRESEKKYRSILKDIKEAYYEVDLKGNHTFFNDALCDLSGYPREELMGMNYQQYLTKETAERVFKAFNEVYKNKIKQKIIDYEIITKNGTKKIFEVSVSLKYDSQNKKCGFYGMAWDITEKKKAEALREKFTEKLEKEVKSRTKELSDTIIKLNEAIEQKDLYANEILKSSQFKTEFMATMSHELRTPLNAIIGFSDLLQETTYGSLNEQQIDFLKDIKSSGEHLLSMINQILDISKIESGEMKLNIKKFPLNDMINQIKSTINPLLDEKQLKFEVVGLETEKLIDVDPLRLKEILYNLLSNAIKFTNAGGIKLKFKEKENQIEFEIVDTGIGIAKEDYDLVFKEFKRVDSPYVNSTPGSGLGLPLTKKLVNMHGGNISFTSELGRGSTFKFTIPKNLRKAD